MDAQEILYYSLSIAIWIFIGLGIFVAVSLVRLFEHIRTITKSAVDLAMNYQLIRGGLKVGFLGIVQRALNLLRNGGGKRG